MDIRRLQALHRELFGAEHPVTNAGHLRRKIAWHVQARKHGGLPGVRASGARWRLRNDAKLRVRMTENTARRKKGIPLDRTVTTSVAPPHDARLPLAGTLLVKEFKGRTQRRQGARQRLRIRRPPVHFVERDRPGDHRHEVEWLSLLRPAPRRIDIAR